MGRMRLCGDESDAEDNVLKELLIAVTLLNYRSSPDTIPADPNRIHENGGDADFESAAAGELQVFLD